MFLVQLIRAESVLAAQPRALNAAPPTRPSMCSPLCADLPTAHVESFLFLSKTIPPTIPLSKYDFQKKNGG
jgi:hypothetical protein